MDRRHYTDELKIDLGTPNKQLWEMYKTQNKQHLQQSEQQHTTQNRK